MEKNIKKNEQKKYISKKEKNIYKISKKKRERKKKNLIFIFNGILLIKDEIIIT